MTDLAQIKDVLEALGRDFEEFKNTNDDRLKQIESKGSADVITKEKLERINGGLDELEGVKKALEQLEKVQARLKVGADGKEIKPESAEHKQAYLDWIRYGDRKQGAFEAELEAKQAAAVEAKALNVTTDGDGGYAVPEDLDRMIGEISAEFSPIRAISTVVTVGTSDYKKLINLKGTASGWVDEDDSRSETDTPTIGQFTPSMGEIYANPAATQTMLDDAFFNVEQFLMTDVAEEFAVEEGLAFVSGNGTKRPKGFLTYATSYLADGSRPYGEIEMIPTGVSGGLPALSGSDEVSPADKLIDVVYTLKARYRQRARWVMNRVSLGVVRKIKDENGMHIWQPSLAAGQPSALLGYPVTEAEDMPDLTTADAKAIAFGDFQAGYMVVDRFGIRTLRDPYTNKPYVHFYTTKRVGGGVYNSEAIKVLRATTSTTS